MKTLRGTALTAAVVGAVLVLGACGAGSDDDDGAAGEEYRIGVVIPPATVSYYERQISGIEAADADLENVEIEWAYHSKELPNGPDEIDGINTLLTKQVDAILMSTALPPAKPSLEKAVDEGVAVIIMDGDLTGLAPDQAPVVATDNAAAGQQAGEFIAETFGKDAKVGLLDGVPEVEPNFLRTEEARKTLEAAGVEVVGRLATGCTSDGGVKATQDLLTSHPEINVLYSACGEPILGASQVLEREGLSDQVSLVGFDAIPAEIDLIKSGKEAASVAQYPETAGYVAVEKAVEAIETGEVPASEDTPTAVVTKANADTYLDDAIPEG